MCYIAICLIHLGESRTDKLWLEVSADEQEGPMINSPTLSVSIISFNEEENIGRCIDAIRDIATEIIVVDSLSTDRTVDIARERGAKVYIEEWKGHVSQKNSSLAKCTQEWVLALDCDEVVTPELRNAIAEAITHRNYTGYRVNRKSFFLGRWIEHANYPDWKLRLIRRSGGIWEGIDPHDTLKIKGPIDRLKGDLHHFSFRDLQDCLNRTVRYAVNESASYYRLGRRARLHNFIFNPLNGFVRHYLIKRGFLDGWQGFLMAVINSISIFMKYALLWELQRGRDNKEQYQP